MFAIPEKHLFAYYVGIAIVIGSHGYMLYSPNKPIGSLEQHAQLNLVAAALIAYYFLHQMNYIKF